LHIVSKGLRFSGRDAPEAKNDSVPTYGLQEKGTSFCAPTLLKASSKKDFSMWSLPAITASFHPISFNRTSSTEFSDLSARRFCVYARRSRNWTQSKDISFVLLDRAQQCCAPTLPKVASGKVFRKSYVGVFARRFLRFSSEAHAPPL